MSRSGEDASSRRSGERAARERPLTRSEAHRARRIRATRPEREACEQALAQAEDEGRITAEIREERLARMRDGVQLKDLDALVADIPFPLRDRQLMPHPGRSGRLLRGLAPWAAALLALVAVCTGLKEMAEWRASEAVAAAKEQAAEERALREAQIGTAADGEGYWGPAYAEAREAGIDLALDGIEPMTEDTVPALLRAVPDADAEAWEEVKLYAESSAVTGRAADGSARVLLFEADDAGTAEEAWDYQRGTGADLDTEGLESFSLEAVVAQAREHEPDAGLGIGYIRIYGGTGEASTHGESGNLVDVSFEGQSPVVTMRLSDLRRLE